MNAEAIKYDGSNKHILYISHDGMTDSLGQSQVLPYLCGLSDLGYEFHLISLDKRDKFELLSSTIYAICNKHNIKWHPIIYTKKPPILNTIYDLFRMRKKAIELNSNHPFDMIHCRGYLPTMIAQPLKRKWRIPLIFDIRGLWINERVDGGIWNLKNPIFYFIYSTLKIKEKSLFKNAETVISLTRKAIPEIHKIQGGIIPHQLNEVIPTCVDTEYFSSENIDLNFRNKTINQFNIKESDFIISYLGSLSTWYLPEEMFDLFKRLLLKKPESKFLIITQDKHEPYRELASKKGIPAEKIILISAIRSEVPTLLSISNASLFFIKPAYSKIASSPTKLAELLSMGIPVICNGGIGDTEEIVRYSNTGIICNEFTDASYDQSIEDFFSNRELKDSDRLRKKSIELFGLKMGVSKYASVYKKTMHHE
jgi:glycosyltransferase involved in cell wall biosynthesis